MAYIVLSVDEYGNMLVMDPYDQNIYCLDERPRSHWMSAASLSLLRP